MSTEGCWIDGRPADCLNVDNRAVQYGDGIFETIRISNGRAEYLPRHLARLRTGCTRLRFAPVPWQIIEQEISDLATDRDNAVLKVILTRGCSERGYRIDRTSPVTRILKLSPAPDIPIAQSVTGVRARICSMRLAVQPVLAGIKHLNRLEQVMARAEWDDPAISEGLLLNERGQLIEGTMSNLFLVRDGELLTPDLSLCGVAGVMRSVIIDVARQGGTRVGIAELTLDDARSADELFICNSLIGIWPIRFIDELGEFVCGPVTQSLLATLGSGKELISGNWYAS